MPLTDNGFFLHIPDATPSSIRALLVTLADRSQVEVPIQVAAAPAPPPN